MPPKKAQAPRKRRKLTKKPSKSLSQLESLPSEVLMDIYLMSDNASLIFCSDYIHGLVQYSNVRTKLVQDCCLDDSFRLRGSTATAHANLRMLLQEQWLTRDLVIKAGMDWARESILQELHDWLIKHEYSIEDIGAPLGSTGAYLLEYRDYLRNVRDKPTVMYRGVLIDQFKTDISAPQIGHCQSVATCYIQPAAISRLGFRLSLVFRRPSRHLASTKAFFPEVDWRAFPAKFLAGPWTQKLGDIFSLLLANPRPGFGLMRTPAKPQVALMRQGLTRAIQEETLPILGLYSGYGFRWGIPMRNYCKKRSSLSVAGLELDDEPWETHRILPEDRYPKSGWKIENDLWNKQHKRSGRVKARELLRRNGGVVGDEWNERTKDCVMYKLLTRER